MFEVEIVLLRTLGVKRNAGMGTPAKHLPCLIYDFYENKIIVDKPRTAMYNYQSAILASKNSSYWRCNNRKRAAPISIDTNWRCNECRFVRKINLPREEEIEEEQTGK